MKPGITYVRKKFDEFNKICFDGQLPTIPIRMSTARNYIGSVRYQVKRNLTGQIVYSDFVLRISTRFDLSEAEVEDTILHEMIHLYVYSNGIQDTAPHGEVFRRMMDELNMRFHRHITVAHRFNEETTNTDMHIKPHVLCVTRLENGKCCVTVCARTRIFDIYRTLSLSPLVREMRWYYSVDPFFNRFPNSLTVKLYRITVEELKEHLKTAVPLECDGRRMLRKKE